MTDDLTLTVNGRVYGGWTEASVTRSITQMAGSFNIAVSERWFGQDRAWAIEPWSAVQVRIGDDLILSGYVDDYQPSYGPAAHSVRVLGRSKTADLVDCSPEIDGGQFKGYKLDAIARAVCNLFGLGVVVQADMGDGFPAATIERAETAYEFLERLCRLRGVFATDDETGNLVLTRAGTTRASGSLREGDNILSASAKLSVAKRFSKYVVRTQHGVTADWDQVVTDVMGASTDGGCPRYRPHVAMGESQLTPAQASARARWQAVYATARGLQASVTLQGWRQPDGSPWRVNQIVPVVSPMLGLDRELLTAAVTTSLKDGEGRRTRLTLGPVEGYTPDPVQVQKTKGDGVSTWNDVQKVS